MVHSDCLFAFTGYTDQIGKQKGVFNHSGIIADAFDKPFGLNLGDDGKKMNLFKADKELQQKPVGRPAIPILRRRSLFENEGLECNKLILRYFKKRIDRV